MPLLKNRSKFYILSSIIIDQHIHRLQQNTCLPLSGLRCSFCPALNAASALPSMQLLPCPRLLEDAALSYHSVANPASAVFNSTMRRTRVLRVMPVSSEIGPPSFPVSSAALEEEPPPQPPLVPRGHRAAHPPGGLSRSLSASASSPQNIIPNNAEATGGMQSGDSQLCVGQLLCNAVKFARLS